MPACIRLFLLLTVCLVTPASILPLPPSAVLTKLTRVLAAILAANGGAHPTNKLLHEQVLELLTQSVLPAMSLIPGNAGACGGVVRRQQPQRTSLPAADLSLCCLGSADIPAVPQQLPLLVLPSSSSAAPDWCNACHN